MEVHYRCTVCGLRLTVTHAQDEEQPPHAIAARTWSPPESNYNPVVLQSLWAIPWTTPGGSMGCPFLPPARGRGAVSSPWHLVARLSGPSVSRGHLPLRHRLRLATSPSRGGNGCVTPAVPFLPQRGEYRPLRAGEGGGVLPVAPRRPCDLDRPISGTPPPLASPPARHLPLKGRRNGWGPPPPRSPAPPRAGAGTAASGAGRGAVSSPWHHVARVIWTVRSRGHLPLWHRLRLATSPSRGGKRVRHACGPVSPPSGGSTARFGRGGGRFPPRGAPSPV